MIASSLKYKIEFYKPSDQRNNRDYSFAFATMGSMVYKGGNMAVINDSVMYNQTIEIYTRRILQPFNESFEIQIDGVKYQILSINTIGNTNKDVHITVSRK